MREGKNERNMPFLRIEKAEQALAREILNQCLISQELPTR